VTKAAAINEFWNSFGLKAFEENTLLDVDENGQEIKPEFPYITYQLVTDSFDREVATTANIWYRTTGWKAINAKTEEISAHIGLGGKIIKCDGGRIWIKRGQPFAQNMGDESDDLIKRKYLNVNIEYFTAH
jgi:hypothetical protein